MREKKNLPVDYKLFFAVVILIVFWMVMISSVSIFSSYELTLKSVYNWLVEEAYNYFYVKRNVLHVLTGFIVLALIVKIHFRFFEKISPYLLWITTLLLWYVHFYWATYKWAKWWIDIPLLPFNIQPTELLKFSLIIFLAYFFKRNFKYLKTFNKGFFPFIVILWIFVWIVGLQPDFWTVMVIVPVSIIMFFLAWANIRYLIGLLLFWIIGAYSIYSAWVYNKELWEKRPKLAYITERIDYFLEDEKKLFDSKAINKDKTYQIKQALITIWSWWATWLWFGKSIQKFGYLPEVQWDFIFSVIIEELWFVWALFLLNMYLYIAWRWFVIYSKVQDLFAKFTAAGISTWFIVQAFINIWVNLNIVPLTWITLPFISYWGSSLITLMLALWLLLNISRYINEKPKFERLRNRI